MRAFNYLAATALSGSLLFVPMAAVAQQAGTTASDSKEGISTTQNREPAPIGTDLATGEASVAASGGKDVVVTGTRIRNPNAQSALPILSVAGDRLLQQSRISIGDSLNELPQFRSTVAQQNVGAGVGVAGLNNLDLRALGTQRTLVLVNGRRHVAGDINNFAAAVDINTIPNALIDRIDTVTGGNSAVYGSDAIAGVVNFVLKRDYNGLELRGNAGMSEAGFGGNQLLSAIAGKNFSEGKGNITVAAEYAHQDRVYGSDIPWYRSVDGFITNDVDPAGLTNGSDGFPDSVFARDIRSGTISRFGLVPVNQSTAVSGCGNALVPTNGAPSNVGGTPYSCTYLFTPDGRLTQQTGTRTGSTFNPGFLGGNGQTGREDQLLSVYPKMNRVNINMLGHYTFSPAFEVFGEAKWVRIRTIGNNAGPLFIQGTGASFDARERIRLDNPFLNPADRATLAAALVAGGTCGSSFVTQCVPAAQLAATNAAIAAGTYRFTLGKQLADLGQRDEDFTRTTWRVVGGVRGNFFDDWSYEVSGNYGRFTENQIYNGYVNKQRFLLSLDAGRNPATGQIQCRSQFDPTAAVAYPATAANQAALAADIAACVPYNPFGSAGNNPAAVGNTAAGNYFLYKAHDRGVITQFDATGFISGTSSKLFSLPGGPIRFALGGEYRADKAYFAQDPFSGDLTPGFSPVGNTTAIAGLSFDAPAIKVKEGFGELQLPLVKDMRYIGTVNLNGAGRVSSYNNTAGTVFAYNFGGDWSPIPDVRFRANYGRSVRAPNNQESGGPLVPNFAPGFADPCRANAIGTGTQYRAANCATDLGATLNNASFANQASYSLPVLSGSNPNLQAEKSDSYTYGVVLQPRVVPNLTVSVDYYNIKVNNVIVSLAAQTIANTCYDQPTLANPFCALFTRYRGAATGPNGEVTGQILGNTLIQAPVNYARRIRRGIDSNVSYRHDLAQDVELAANLVYTHNLTTSDYTNPQLPDFETRLLENLSYPKDEFVLTADLKVKQFTFGYRLRYIGAMYNGAIENYVSIQGRPPQNADVADITKYPAIAYHGFRVEWNIRNDGGLGKLFQFYGGVDNVFDRHPPLGSTATTTASSIYDYRGRSLYAGARVAF